MAGSEASKPGGRLDLSFPTCIGGVTSVAPDGTWAVFVVGGKDDILQGHGHTLALAPNQITGNLVSSH